MSLFDIVLWIFFGALAGWIASLIMKTDRQMGALANIIAGVAGSFIGGFIMENFFGREGFTGFDLYSFFVAVGGAVVLIFVVTLLRGGRRRR